MASTVTHTHSNGQADPLAATHPRPDSIHVAGLGLVAAHTPAARAARHTTQAVTTWIRGPLTRSIRRTLDLLLVLAGFTLVAVGSALAWLPAGFIVGGLAILYIQAWLAATTVPEPPPAPPARRIDEP